MIFERLSSRNYTKPLFQPANIEEINDLINKRLKNFSSNIPIYFSIVSCFLLTRKEIIQRVKYVRGVYDPKLGDITEVGENYEEEVKQTILKLSLIHI